jgi:hypothetical protein
MQCYRQGVLSAVPRLCRSSAFSWVRDSTLSLPSVPVVWNTYVSQPDCYTTQASRSKSWFSSHVCGRCYGWLMWLLKLHPCYSILSTADPQTRNLHHAGSQWAVISKCLKLPCLSHHFSDSSVPSLCSAIIECLIILVVRSTWRIQELCNLCILQTALKDSW